ncbi:unnamed protein product [Rotaria sordida]|uniref:Uncharacterized protein n=1 Tax=Rotaria sordida TaxID=392033 RepID=A0A815TKP9_9BILA|nr:unnamed protein product [Rotaria sordida]
MMNSNGDEGQPLTNPHNDYTLTETTKIMKRPSLLLKKKVKTDKKELDMDDLKKELDIIYYENILSTIKCNK